MGSRLQKGCAVSNSARLGPDCSWRLGPSPTLETVRGGEEAGQAQHRFPGCGSALMEDHALRSDSSLPSSQGPALQRVWDLILRASTSSPGLSRARSRETGCPQGQGLRAQTC